MRKKRFWLSIVLVMAVAVGAGYATFAYFTAQRTTSSNRFATGTLDLNVSANGNALEPFVIENMGDNANISGTKTWTIKNTGSLPGRLLVRLQNVKNEENGCNDQEKGAEPNCDQIDDEGDLGNVINLKIAYDGVDRVESTLASNQIQKIGNDWNALTPIIVQPGEEKSLTAYWAADETQYGNEVQSDSVEFDMNFRLIQLINGPTPTN